MSDEKRYPRRWDVRNGTFYEVRAPGERALMSVKGNYEQSIMDESDLSNTTIWPETFDHHAPPTPDHAELVARLAAAAEEAVKALKSAQAYLDWGDRSLMNVHSMVRENADALTAALAQLPPELRGTT